jgi:hypothetical protein
MEDINGNSIIREERNEERKSDVMKRITKET